MQLYHFNFICIDGGLCNELHEIQGKKRAYELFNHPWNVPGCSFNDIIVYSGASGLGFLICKGFFDTIPASLREAAKIEGASELSIFLKVVVPISKPIIVYTVINSFLNPWMDFVMARLMIRSKDAADWTVAIGLYNMLQRSLVGEYFSIFCAGGLMIAVPISILFVIMQKYYVEGITRGAVKG